MKNRKQNIIPAVLALSLPIVLTACGSSQGGDNGEVIVYNWG